jgi:hypothetical protein
LARVTRMAERRFPPPWSIDELEACFVVKRAGARLSDSNPIGAHEPRGSAADFTVVRSRRRPAPMAAPRKIRAKRARARQRERRRRRQIALVAHGLEPGCDRATAKANIGVVTIEDPVCGSGPCRSRRQSRRCTSLCWLCSIPSQRWAKRNQNSRSVLLVAVAAWARHCSICF